MSRSFAVGTVGTTTLLHIFCIRILSREKVLLYNTTRTRYIFINDVKSTTLTTCLLFSACRVILSNPAQAAERVAFGGWQASGRRVEGAWRDGGASGQVGSCWTLVELTGGRAGIWPTRVAVRNPRDRVLNVIHFLF